MSKTGFKNVPPPAGSKSASPYQRFIPREELGDFASWKPGTFAGTGTANGLESINMIVIVIY